MRSNAVRPLEKPVLSGPFDLKVVFFGGKGGVGKTTCASAFSLLSSEKNRKTLLVSTDPAHSLSDLFGISIGNQEREILPGLNALEIDPDEEARDYILNIKIQTRGLIDPEARPTFDQQMDLAAVSPGVQEAAMFDKIASLITRDNNPYDLLVFDTAPTGQTLRLLSLPELMGAWTRSLAKRRRKVSSLWKMFSTVSDEDPGEDHALELIENRRLKFDRVRTLLKDPASAGFYLVLIPEKLPILETQKTIPVLEKYEMPIKGLIVNRLLPETVEGDFLLNRKKQEQHYTREIKTQFKAYKPIFLYQKDSDVMDLEGLKTMGRELGAALTMMGEQEDFSPLRDSK